MVTKVETICKITYAEIQELDICTPHSLREIYLTC